MVRVQYYVPCLFDPHRTPQIPPLLLFCPEFFFFSIMNNRQQIAICSQLASYIPLFPFLAHACQLGDTTLLNPLNFKLLPSSFLNALIKLLPSSFLSTLISQLRHDKMHQRLNQCGYRSPMVTLPGGPTQCPAVYRVPNNDGRQTGILSRCEMDSSSCVARVPPPPAAAPPSLPHTWCTYVACRSPWAPARCNDTKCPSALSNWNILFLAISVLMGLCISVIIAIVLNNLSRRRSYPSFW